MSSTTLVSPNQKRIEKILERLSTLDVERAVLQSELAELEKQPPISTDSIRHVRRVLSPDQKIEIFLNLFRGRTDVFPKRWDNQKPPRAKTDIIRSSSCSADLSGIRSMLNSRRHCVRSHIRSSYARQIYK
jgi:hypothetical protein